MAWEMKWKANTKIDGRSSFQLQASRPGSQERALVNLEPPMCCIDVHCSYGLTRTEKSPGPTPA